MRLIAIAGEALGHEEFLEHWPGELYIDEGKRGVFAVLDAGKQSLIGGALSYYTGGGVAKNVERCDAKGVTGNMAGEGLKLGGVWAFSPEPALVWEHKEARWGDIVEGGRLAALRAAVGEFAGAG